MTCRAAVPRDLPRAAEEVAAPRPCGCRVEIIGVLYSRLGRWTPLEEIAGGADSARVIYCPTHAAAFQLAEALDHSVLLFEPVARTGTEGQWVENARRLLTELGR